MYFQNPKTGIRNRAVALLLAPCLILEPATAGGLHSFSFRPPPIENRLNGACRAQFQEEALTLTLVSALWLGRALAQKALSARIPHEAGQLLKTGIPGWAHAALSYYWPYAVVVGIATIVSWWYFLRRPAVEVIHPKRMAAGPPEMIAWDFDQTLWDGYPAELQAQLWAESIHRVDPKHARHIKGILDRTRGLSPEERYRALERDGKRLPEQDRFLETVRERLDREIQVNNLTHPRYLVPGVADLLRAFEEAGLRQEVFTGGRAENRRKYAQKLGIDGYFSDFHGEGRKGEALYQTIQQAAGGSPWHRVLALIGDGAADMRAAREAEQRAREAGQSLHVVAVGFARTRSDRRMLIDAGADVIINRDFRKTRRILDTLLVRRASPFPAAPSENSGSERQSSEGQRGTMPRHLGHRVREGVLAIWESMASRLKSWKMGPSFATPTPVLVLWGAEATTMMPAMIQSRQIGGAWLEGVEKSLQNFEPSAGDYLTTRVRGVFVADDMPVLAAITFDQPGNPRILLNSRIIPENPAHRSLQDRAPTEGWLWLNVLLLRHLADALWLSRAGHPVSSETAIALFLRDAQAFHSLADVDRRAVQSALVALGLQTLLKTWEQIPPDDLTAPHTLWTAYEFSHRQQGVSTSAFLNVLRIIELLRQLSRASAISSSWRANYLQILRQRLQRVTAEYRQLKQRKRWLRYQIGIASPGERVGLYVASAQPRIAKNMRVAAREAGKALLGIAAIGALLFIVISVMLGLPTLLFGGGNGVIKLGVSIGLLVGVGGPVFMGALYALAGIPLLIAISFYQAITTMARAAHRRARPTDAAELAELQAREPQLQHTVRLHQAAFDAELSLVRKGGSPGGAGAVGFFWQGVAKFLDGAGVGRWATGLATFAIAAAGEGAAIAWAANHFAGTHPWWFTPVIGLPLGALLHALLGILVLNAEGKWDNVGLLSGRSPPPGFWKGVLHSTLAFSASFVSLIPISYHSSFSITLLAAILPHLFLSLGYLRRLYRNQTTAAPPAAGPPAPVEGEVSLSAAPQRSSEAPVSGAKLDAGLIRKGDMLIEMLQYLRTLLPLAPPVPSDSPFEHLHRKPLFVDRLASRYPVDALISALRQWYAWQPASWSELFARPRLEAELEALEEAVGSALKDALVLVGSEAKTYAKDIIRNGREDLRLREFFGRLLISHATVTDIPELIALLDLPARDHRTDLIPDDRIPVAAAAMLGRFESDATAAIPALGRQVLQDLTKHDGVLHVLGAACLVSLMRIDPEAPLAGTAPPITGGELSLRLLSHLHDENRRHAVDALISNPSYPPAIPALHQQLAQELDPNVKRYIQEKLGGFEHPSSSRKPSREPPHSLRGAGPMAKSSEGTGPDTEHVAPAPAAGLEGLPEQLKSFADRFGVDCFKILRPTVGNDPSAWQALTDGLLLLKDKIETSADLEAYGQAIAAIIQAIGVEEAQTVIHDGLPPAIGQIHVPGDLFKMDLLIGGLRNQAFLDSSRRVKLYGAIGVLERAKLSRQQTAAAAPNDTKHLIIRLAEDLGKSGPELYRTVIKHLQVKDGTAVDIGTGGYYDVARGLLEAGVKKVICVDDQWESFLGGVLLPAGAERSQQDAFHLNLSDGQVHIVVFNESLEWLWKYKQESLGREVSREDVYREALEEAFRILSPGGCVLIKTGNYVNAKNPHGDARKVEGPLCKSLLSDIGFKDIELLRSGETPVFLWARKPAGAPTNLGKSKNKKGSMLSVALIAAGSALLGSGAGAFQWGWPKLTPPLIGAGLTIVEPSSIGLQGLILATSGVIYWLGRFGRRPARLFKAPALLAGAA